MRKLLLRSIVLIAISTLPVFAWQGDVVTLDKTNLEKPELSTGEINQSIKGSLLISDSETLANLIDEQKKHDLKDLEKLWQGTVEITTLLSLHSKNSQPLNHKEGFILH